MSTSDVGDWSMEVLFIFTFHSSYASWSDQFLHVFFILKAEVWFTFNLTRCWIFSFRFLTIAGATISIETNTNSWLFSDIIEQDLTAVIRFVNLYFDWALNPFRLVVAQSDLGGCDTWNYGWGKKWTINNSLYILTISEVSKFLCQQFSKLAISSTFVQF